VTRDGAADDDDGDDDDDERYSRQMYTLGARAHRLVRSATAVLDGPTGGGSSRGGNGDDGGTMTTAPSGLLYEIAKNLALSGVGRIVLVGEDDDDGGGDHDRVDVGYFDRSLDDLGAAYRRAALAEVGGGGVVVVGEGGGAMATSSAPPPTTGMEVLTGGPAFATTMTERRCWQNTYDGSIRACGSTSCPVWR